MDGGAPGSATGLSAPNAGVVGSAPTRDVKKGRRKMKTDMAVTKSAAFNAGVVYELEKQASVFDPGKSLIAGAVRKFKARKALKAMGVTNSASLAAKTKELGARAMRFADNKPYNRIRELGLAAGLS